jgi:hypothetical protein
MFLHVGTHTLPYPYMFIRLRTHPSLIHICSSIWGHIPPSSIYVRPLGDTSLPHPYMFVHLGTHPSLIHICSSIWGHIPPSSIYVHPFRVTSCLIHMCSSIWGHIPPSFIHIHPFRDTSLPHPYMFIHFQAHPPFLLFPWFMELWSCRK